MKMKLRNRHLGREADYVGELVVCREAKDNSYLRDLFRLDPDFMRYQYALVTLRQSVYNNMYLRYMHFERARSLLSLTTDGKRILDVGSGYGDLSLELANRGKEVVLMDLSQRALFIARLRFRKLNLKCELVVGDACQLPFRGSSFDASFSNQVIEHVTRPFKMLSEQLRVSKLRVIVVGLNVFSTRALPFLGFVYFRLLRRCRSETDPNLGGYDEEYYINPQLPPLDSKMIVLLAKIVASLPFLGRLLAGQAVKVYNKKPSTKG